MQHILHQEHHKGDKPEGGSRTSEPIQVWFNLECHLHGIQHLCQQFPKDSTLIVKHYGKIVQRNSCLGPCDVYVHRNLKWYHSHPGSPLVWLHYTSNQVVLSGLVIRICLGFWGRWNIGMLTWQHYTDILFWVIWVNEYWPYLLEKLSWSPASGVSLSIAAWK